MRMYNYNILLYLFATCIFNVLKIYIYACIIYVLYLRAFKIRGNKIN